MCCSLLVVKWTGRLPVRLSGTALIQLSESRWPPVDWAVKLPPATRTKSSEPAGACDGCRTTAFRASAAWSAAGQLHHGVAAVQRLLRGEGAHLVAEVDDLVGGPQHRGADGGA